MLTKLMMIVILQNMHIWNHYVVHFKVVQYFMSIIGKGKLGKKVNWVYCRQKKKIIYIVVRIVFFNLWRAFPYMGFSKLVYSFTYSRTSWLLQVFGDYDWCAINIGVQVSVSCRAQVFISIEEMPKSKMLYNEYDKECA